MNLAEVTQWLVLNGFQKIDGSLSPDGEVIVRPGCSEPHWTVAQFPNVEEIYLNVEPGDGSNLSFTVGATGAVEAVSLGETHSGGHFAEADEIEEWGVEVLPELIKALRLAYIQLSEGTEAMSLSQLKQALGSCADKLQIQQEYFQ